MMQDDVLAQVFAGLGFNPGLDLSQSLQTANAQDLSKDQEEARRQAAIVRACVKGPEGAAFMEWLAGKTILFPLRGGEVAPESVEAAALAAQRRVGRNQIFEAIVAALTMDLATASAPVPEAD